MELWRNYFPTKTSYRFLGNTPSTYLQGIKQLPKNGDMLVIGKSLKDVMYMYEQEVSSIAPTSETIIISEKQILKLKESFPQIILFGDNDLAGIKSLNKWKKKYPWITIVFLKRKFAKDITDLAFKSKIDAMRAMDELKDIQNKTNLQYFYKF